MGIRPHSFRALRATLKATRIECQLLLAVQGVIWTEREYGTFFVMNDIWHKTSNPTYKQMIAMVVGWLRFYRRLWERLPEGEFRGNMEREWSKLSIGYESLLEEKVK